MKYLFKNLQQRDLKKINKYSILFVCIYMNDISKFHSFLASHFAQLALFYCIFLHKEETTGRQKETQKWKQNQTNSQQKLFPWNNCVRLLWLHPHNILCLKRNCELCAVQRCAHVETKKQCSALQDGGRKISNINNNTEKYKLPHTLIIHSRTSPKCFCSSGCTASQPSLTVL